MKKILFVIESLSGGGAEKVLTTLVKNLDKKKFDITVLTIVNTGIYLEDIKQQCKVLFLLPEYESCSVLEKIKYRINYKKIYSAPIQNVYQRYVKDIFDIEIAFVEGFATKFVAASLNNCSKKICWLHIDMENNPYADRYYLSLQEEYDVYEKYDKIIGVSESVKEAFERKFSLPDSVEVIYNPVDQNEISAKAHLEQIDRGGDLQLISIGRLTRQKGYDRLINVLGTLKNYNFKYKLWILGEGPERSELEKIISEYQLENDVKLLGFKQNPYSYLKSSDAFICSSRAEGYSLVIAEAMLLGKPVLSVDCAGPNELLNFGQYGVMVPNTEVELKSMIYQLLSGNIDLEKYAQLSMKRQSFFELGNIIRRLEEMLLS